MMNPRVLSMSALTRATPASPVLHSKPTTFKILVLGQSGVGKSALVMRFITGRFIGENNPNLKNILFNALQTFETVSFKILDSTDMTRWAIAYFKQDICWADAIILVYSVTDVHSFHECHRLRFLINYYTKMPCFNSFKDNKANVPVILVGNKTDQINHRKVSTEEGQRRHVELDCMAFYEISVKKSIKQVLRVFSHLHRFWRVGNEWLQREGDRHPSALPPNRPPSPVPSSPNATPFVFSRRCIDMPLVEEDEQLQVVQSD